jgi:hypothetical protein
VHGILSRLHSQEEFGLNISGTFERVLNRLYSDERRGHTYRNSVLAVRQVKLAVLWSLNFLKTAGATIDPKVCATCFFLCDHKIQSIAMLARSI